MCFSRIFIQIKRIELTLSLLVLGILTDNSDLPFSLDHFAFLANRFYWWSNFHVKPSFQKDRFTL